MNVGRKVVKDVSNESIFFSNSHEFGFASFKSKVVCLWQGREQSSGCLGHHIEDVL